MTKPFILFQGPIATRSGYGDHARDLALELLKSNKYDVRIASLRWGNTPMNALNEQNPDHKLILDNMIYEGKLEKQPDLHIQVTVPQEFQQIGKKNLGITAGLEATAIDPLKGLGERTGNEVIAGAQGGDAAALAYAALEAAGADGTVFLIIDTAGRLQNRREFLDER